MWANIGVPSSDVPAEVDSLHMRIERHEVLVTQSKIISTPEEIGLTPNIINVKFVLDVELIKSNVTELVICVNEILKIEYNLPIWGAMTVYNVHSIILNMKNV